MAKFISDDEMVKLEYSAKPRKFISDEEMAALEEAPDEPSDFDIKNPMSSLLKMSAKQGLKNLQSVGEFADKYTGAPTRAGLLAAVKGQDPLGAAKSQFGEDPSLAPTGERILEEAGVENKFAKKAGGFAVDVLADPLNVIPVTKLAGVGKVAGLLEKAPKALKAYSEGKAIKQAGGMLKDFRRIMGKGRAEEIGQSLLKESVSIADEAGNIKDVPLMKAGDTVEDIAEKSDILKKQIGEKIGSVYRDIDDKITNPEFLKTLTDDQRKVLSQSERFDPRKDFLDIYSNVVSKFEKKIGGSAVVQKVESIANDISKRGNTLDDALELKKELDELVNYSKKTQELPEVQKAIVEIRNFIRDKTNKYVDDVSSVLGVEEGKNLRQLNKRYGGVSEVAEMSADRVAREAANRMISPSDYGAGVGGAILGAATGGPIGGLLTAGAGTVLNKLARERGPGILARGAESLSKAPTGASLLRSLEMADKPVVRGLLKKSKREE